jgi:hypothetical protein
VSIAGGIVNGRYRIWLVECTSPRWRLYVPPT